MTRSHLAPPSALKTMLARLIATGALVAAIVVAPTLARASLKVMDDAPRFAVVVGNQSYPDAPLANPLNDARAISNVLRELDFDVLLVEDATLETLQALAERLATFYPEGSVGVFFYAGHAVQHRGENYLLPVDMAIDAPAELPSQSVALSRILQSFDTAGVALRIVVLDACRDYPFGALNEAFGAGLADVDASGETLIAYATRAGAVAYDGAGPNSPYTGALVSALELPERDIYDVFKTVRFKVREATNGRQLPWLGGSIESSFVFRRGDQRLDGPPIVNAAFDPAEIHWRTIAKSDDPTDLIRFVNAHPNSEFVEEAVARLELLLAQQKDAVPAPDVSVATLPGAGASVTRCDRWASDPLDPRRISEGVPWGLVNTRQAIRDCAAAVAEDPDNPRLNFNFARALDIAERFEEARNFYDRADAQDYGAAARNLGFMHRNGRGVPPDDPRAAEYYIKASMLGVLDARKALAKLYEEGWGVPQSFDETIRWLSLAAEDGLPNALDHLGNLYRDGDGVEQDVDRALALYRRAAALDSGNGTANVARMFRDGLAVDADLPAAVELYERAIELGSPFAPYHLARIYLKGGDGVAPAPARARELLELAVDMGREWALWQLGQSYAFGEFGEKDLEQALFYLAIAVETGEALRNDAGAKLAEVAGDRLREVAAEAGPDVATAAKTRADQWIQQNSLYDFALIYPY